MFEVIYDSKTTENISRMEDAIRVRSKSIVEKAFEDNFSAQKAKDLILKDSILNMWKARLVDIHLKATPKFRITTG